MYASRLSAPFKHYLKPIISDVFGEEIDPANAGDGSSAQSARRWGHWLMMNELNIDGHLNSVAHRELDFSEELLRSGVVLLRKLRSSIPDGCLRTILWITYNSGKSKRKIEKFHQVTDDFLAEAKAQKIRTLDELNRYWTIYLEGYYHK